MNRFRSSFLEHMDEGHVPFRYRDDFAAPLVTITGHTYGVRVVAGEGGSDQRIAVEISANVYDDEFDFERFESRIEESHQESTIIRTVENFMSSEENGYIKKKAGPMLLPSFFVIKYDRDLVLIQKEKKSASKITGRFTDTILIVKYWVKDAGIDALSNDLQLFASAVYLYCLRSFALAYRKTLKA